MAQQTFDDREKSKKVRKKESKQKEKEELRSKGRRKGIAPEPL